MIDDPATRGLHLKSMREEAGLSQSKLAEMLGVNRSLISLVETGRSGLSIEHLLSWVDACDGDIRRIVPIKSDPLTTKIRRLPKDRQELVNYLVGVLEWCEQRLVRVIHGFLKLHTEFERGVEEPAEWTTKGTSDEAAPLSGRPHPIEDDD